jgi:nitrite reductase/ring-hydroxylating ferredoxin subunit
MASYITIPDPEANYPVSPDAEFPRARGDAITGERYTSKDFANLEWEKMWTRVWHLGGRVSQLEEAGDFITHNFLRQSVMMVKQKDGGIRAFHNVCRHRGNRLVGSTEGGVNEHFTCPYHGWKWGIDGALNWVQDEEDFAEGIHICNASTKLNSVNRSQTVFKAAQLGDISLSRCHAPDSQTAMKIIAPAECANEETGCGQ